MNKFHFKIFITLCALIFTTAPLISNAANQLVPENISGVTKINAESLINLLNVKPELVIIDARMGDRAQGYIEGSISLPDVETTCSSLSKHIKTKTTASAFYCNGEKCGRSVNAVKIALKCGYKNIHWYRGGFIDWRDKGYPIVK